MKIELGYLRLGLDILLYGASLFEFLVAYFLTNLNQNFFIARLILISYIPPF